MQINIFHTVAQLNKAAASEILRLSKQCIQSTGRFTIALSGGNTPLQVYALLSEKPYSEKFDWENIFFFWGDERCVPYQNKENNAFMAKQMLLNKVPVPAKNIFRIKTAAASPGTAAKNYEACLKKFFGTALPTFDLILLGMGTDGHTASLFPNTGILQQKNALVSSVYHKESSKYRVSFTLPLINHAKNLLLLVTGEAKKKPLSSLINGNRKIYPVQHLNRNVLTVFADKDAAPLLHAKNQAP